METQETVVHQDDSMSFVDVDLHDTITAIASPGDQYCPDQFYPIDKLDAHVMDIPHLAVSIFIFHHGQLLLQRRAATKYHSGGLWTNSVCSHPRWQEVVEDCAQRRLQEEIGLNCDLMQFATISYRAQVGKLFEHERVHCFVGYVDDLDRQNDVMANPQEVEATNWMSLPEIDKQLSLSPEQFTEWFKIYMHTHRELISSVALQ